MKRLIIRPGAMGDCVLSLPAMESLRVDYTEVWVTSRNRALIRFADATDSIVSTGLDLVGLPEVEPPEALIQRLRSFDSIVSWYGSDRAEFRTAVERLNLPFQFFRALPDEQAGTHAAEFFLDQVRGFSTCRVEPVPRIECSRRDEGFAVIHPFSGSPKKNWPLERYNELAALLSQRLTVRWCAGPEETLDGAMRFDDLYELARWFAHATVYIGNDSGPTHLAAAVGTPVVALFGPTSPELWAPRGPSVQVVAVPGCGPMEAIPVDRVADAVNRVLSARSRRR
ncbi:MAG: glycosyltransferase family 9 protein [Bryobacteraceae bacterium]